MFTLGSLYARCTLCATDFSVIHGGRNDVTSHLKSKRHINMSKIVQSTTPITSLFCQSSSDEAIEAEVRWATFVAKQGREEVFLRHLGQCMLEAPTDPI